MSKLIMKKFDGDEESIASGGSTPKTFEAHYNKNDTISYNSKRLDGNIFTKKILFSGKNKRQYSDVSCIEIYQDMTNKIQDNMKNNSETRASFVSSITTVLKSLEEYLERFTETEEDKFTDFLELIQARNVLQNKLDKKLSTVEDHINKLFQSTEKNNEDRIKNRNIAREKFIANIDKFKTSLPEIVEKEQSAKMEALREALAIFNE